MTDQKREYTFNFKFKMKDCKRVFKEGWEPGVLVVQETSYKLTLKQRKSHRFLMQLNNDYDDFIQEYIVSNCIEET